MMFRKKLISLYRDYPTSILPNAIWKTLADLGSIETVITHNQKDEIISFELYRKAGYYLYWHINQLPPKVSKEILDSIHLVLTHQNYLESYPEDQFPNRTPYFRLVYKKETILPTFRLSRNFKIKDIEIESELDKIVEVLAQCYPDWQFSEERIISWTKHPVFDRNGWIWVIDEIKNTPAGMGIAELDMTIPEASLEWIQVLPEYRNQGIGKAIVIELLNRYKDKVKFITVSGKVNNQTNPEELYKKCGFKGRDIWWVLSKRGG